MFGPEFYPTPPAVIDMMTAGIDIPGNVFLEPSAGKGNIVDYLTKAGARDVMACELHPDLRAIVGRKCRVIGSDFFNVTSEEISHINFIIMNPPFSNGSKHIQHAWDIAPDGCEIIALCNIETIKNRYNSSRTILGEVVDKNGYYQEIGNVFSTAERETNVSVAIVHLKKPKEGTGEFDDFLFDMTPDQEEFMEGSGIMRHNDVREVVNRYIAAVNMFDGVMAASREINAMIKPIDTELNITFGAHQYSRNYSSNEPITRDTFKKQLQKSGWRSIFKIMNLQKFVTRGVMEDINKFVEQQIAVPFTMKNIYSMIEIIIGTHGSRMEKVLVEAFDKICSLSADNSTAGEKWKTNSNYKVNRRFIDTWVCEYETWRSDLTHVHLYYSAHDRYDDIIKALCYLTGKKYENTHQFYRFVDDRKMIWGQWYEWEFFRIRGYKKGTMHFEFLDEKVWQEFNRRVAKAKGWQLPQKTDTKTKGTERTRTMGVDLFDMET